MKNKASEKSFSEIKRITDYKKELLKSILYDQALEISAVIFNYIVLNKKIEISSFKGCVQKMNLIKEQESRLMTELKLIRGLSDYES